MRFLIGLVLLSLILIGIGYYIRTPDASDEIEEALVRHAERSDYAVVPPVENFRFKGSRVQGTNIYYTDSLERAKEYARTVGVKEVVNLKDRENPIPVE